MKRSSNFILRDVAGTLVIVPVGSAVSDFPGMITLNSTGAYIWELLESEQTVESLVEALQARYDVEQDLARTDVEAFIKRLQSTGALG